MGEKTEPTLQELQYLALQRKLHSAWHFSEEQRRMIVRACLVDHVKKSQLAAEYGINVGTIRNWINTFADGNVPAAHLKARSKATFKPESTPMPRKKQIQTETQEEELARLREENKRLQEALKMAEWSNHAKDVMIDLAEKTFNIPIRKKSGAKQ